MRKFIFVLICFFVSFNSFGQDADTTVVALDEIVVSSFYQSSSTVSSIMGPKEIARVNYGQEPSHLFSKMPSIVSMNDNGTEFGYGYYRIRGLDQTRINVTLDGCPWNEAEDYGAYFANSPDLMSSMQSIRVERGAGSSYNGIAGVAGGIILESINIFNPDNESYVYTSTGSFNTYKGTVVYNMYPTNGWGLHVKTTYQHTDGFRDYGFNNSQAVTIKTGYKINDKQTIDILSMNGWHKNGQGWLGNTLEELAVNPMATGNTKAETDNWFMSMNRIQYKMWATDNLLVSSSVYYQFQDGSYRMDLDNYMRRMVGESSNTNILYDYGLTHRMVGANLVGKYYMNPLTLTVGANGYTFSRDHFLDNKSVNTTDADYYSNRGIKTDVTTAEAEIEFVVAVDVAGANLLGDNLANYAHKVDLCIDHHGSNGEYAKYLCLKADYPAAAQLMYEVIIAMNGEITPHVADCLYTGMLTDTGCFKYSSTTPLTHIIGAKLMELGAQHTMLVEKFFMSKTRKSVQMEKYMLNNLEYYFDDRCALLVFTREAILDIQPDPTDFDGLSSMPRDFEGVDVSILIRPLREEGNYKLSIRTGENVDACALAASLGGGGHIRAAGCEVVGSIETVKKAILKEVENALCQ